MTNHRRGVGERGAAALSLLTVGIIVGFAIFAYMAVPLTNASDAKAKSNSAADAAALAGVEYMKQDLAVALADAGWLGNWAAYQPFVGTGRTAAQSYALRNEAELIEYTFDPDTWQAYAKVKGRTVEGQVFTSKATARLDLPDCKLGPDDPDDSNPPADENVDTPPPVKLTCGGVDITINPTEDEPDLFNLPGSFIQTLLDQSHAKLVS